MAVKIRLTRMGSKGNAFFRLVAADSRSARDGKVIENLGFYNPMKTPSEINLKVDRINYWLSTGAQPTETAKELLVKEGIVKKEKYRAPKPKQLPPAPKVKAEPKQEAAPAAAEVTEEVKE